MTAPGPDAGPRPLRERRELTGVPLVFDRDRALTPGTATTVLASIDHGDWCGTV
jgi:hypothetical protein